MNLLFRAAAVLLLSALLSILLRKEIPELALLLSLTAICTVLVTALETAKQRRALVSTVQSILKNADMLTAPVLKCLGIAVTTRIASELCRDASQGAASAALEFMGTICALTVAMPLILSLLKSIGGLL